MPHYKVNVTINIALAETVEWAQAHGAEHPLIDAVSAALGHSTAAEAVADALSAAHYAVDGLWFTIDGTVRCRAKHG